MFDHTGIFSLTYAFRLIFRVSQTIDTIDALTIVMFIANSVGLNGVHAGSRPSRR
ncbi:Uncharacterised protein [Serratia plymuthica]|nr:Uncharacterised protein [Serratia plymuthica]VEI20307.1 Uncharacterised protein [Serratia plymuthica]